MSAFSFCPFAPAVPRGRRRLARAVGAGALLALASIPVAGAGAAHASYVGVYTAPSGDPSLLYMAELTPEDYGRANHVGISPMTALAPDAGGYEVREFKPRITLALGPGCVRGPLGPGHTLCHDGATAATKISQLQMFLGAGNDVGGAPGVTVGVRPLDGGEGDDVLLGGKGADTLIGGPGDDILKGGPLTDHLSGDEGADVIDGDDGIDVADYRSYAAPVTVTLNHIADDGADDERDNVDTEIVVGGAQGDTLTGNGETNWLDGNGGDDVLEGLGGADTLAGDAGDDTVLALDNARDRVICGEGNDQVLADWVDDVDADCESVSRI